MNNFIMMLCAHLIADYPLQGDFLAKNKGHNAILLHSHAAMYAGVMYLTMNLLLDRRLDVWAFIVIYATHALIDDTKCRLGKQAPDKALTSYLFIDQVLHMIINCLVFALL